MLDFNHLSPEDFELLSEELLRALGFAIESRPARGPDKGKDILATRYVTDLTGHVDEERYLVECKHLSKSGRSVREADIGNFQAKLGLHRANRYLLITSTVPSETVRDHLSALSRDPTNPYKAGFWARHDLNRFLEGQPSVRDRYFSPAVFPDSPAPAVALELACWMKADGFSFTYPIGAVQDGGIAILFESPRGQVLAFCVGSEGNVANLETTKTLARQFSVQEAWLVARSRVAPSAQARAADLKGVKAFTISDYVRSIVSQYRKLLSEKLAQAGITDNYVELGFEKATFASDDSEMARDTYASVTGYVRAWSEEPGSTHLLLLRDYGSGKTWISLRYSSIQLEEFFEYPLGRRLPIYIPLREIDPTKDVLNQVASFLEHNYGLTIATSGPTLSALNNAGRLLFVLDGFDEFVRLGDEQRMIQSIAALRSLLVPGSKVLLTSRGHFFRSSWQAQNLFDRALGLSSAFEVMRLSTDVALFTDADIHEIVNRRLGRRAEHALSIMRSTYNLMDLARRPLLLTMIIESLSMLGDVPLTVFSLYENYTRAWLHREEWRGVAPHTQRGDFAEQLAWHMYTTERQVITADELESFIQEMSGTQEESVLHALDYDLRTSAFIVRHGVASFSFAHKSFMEFFSAKWILRSLAAHRPECLAHVREGGRDVFGEGIDRFLREADGPQRAVDFLNDLWQSDRAEPAKRVLELLKGS